MLNVLIRFPEKAKIVVVHKDHQALACGMILGFKNTLKNPWASALRDYSRLSPNMLLYWSMLQYACDQGFRYFDFGRSSPEEGTYKFKAQWGAKPVPLHWHYIVLDGRGMHESRNERSKYEKAIQYWRRLPVPVTRMIGPMIRKHIGL
jgi:CelD/BcsL family acetyltransferase involved in cellulose biosynthesis